MNSLNLKIDRSILISDCNVEVNTLLEYAQGKHFPLV